MRGVIVKPQTKGCFSLADVLFAAQGAFEQVYDVGGITVKVPFYINIIVGSCGGGALCGGHLWEYLAPWFVTEHATSSLWSADAGSGANIA